MTDYTSQYQGREMRVFWAITNDHHVVQAQGFDCHNPLVPGGNKDIWWVPELGYSMTLGAHIFHSRAVAIDKALQELVAVEEITRKQIVRLKEEALQLREKLPAITRWFTFGQAHEHQLPDGRWCDKNTVVKIHGVNPRQTMVDHFGVKWCYEYDAEPNMALYPGGIIEL